MDSLAFIFMSDFSFWRLPSPLSHISMLAVTPSLLALQRGFLLCLDHLQRRLDSKGTFEINSWLLSKPACISENMLIVLIVSSVTDFSWDFREKSERKQARDDRRRSFLIYYISLLASSCYYHFYYLSKQNNVPIAFYYYTIQNSFFLVYYVIFYMY